MKVDITPIPPPPPVVENFDVRITASREELEILEELLRCGYLHNSIPAGPSTYSIVDTLVGQAIRNALRRQL